jgi:hypothetical protein
MDMTVDKDAIIPNALKHRFKIAVAKTPSADPGVDPDPAPEPSHMQGQAERWCSLPNLGPGLSNNFSMA